jgi:hypothetical protein
MCNLIRVKKLLNDAHPFSFSYIGERLTKILIFKVRKNQKDH